MPTEYVEEAFEPTRLYLTCVDLKLFFTQYDVWEIEYIGGVKFKKCKGIFNDYIDYWMDIKINNSGAIKTNAKLMLNALYGKFATNPDVTGKIPYLDEGIVRYSLDDKTIRDPIYTAMGAFITAEARYLTISTGQSIYDRFIYADTDSIHLEGTEIPDIEVHPSKLGAWKHESTFVRARFIRSKTYIEDEICNTFYLPDKKLYGTTHLNVKCAGMPDTIKEKVTWENFHKNFSSYGKLRPCHVEGGIVLEDSEFTIK